MSQIWNISGHRVAGRTACTAHCTLNGHFLLATFFFSFLSKMQKEWRIAPENGDKIKKKRRLNMRSAVVSTVRGVFFIISAVLMESSERILQFATVKPCEMDNRVPELWGNIRVSAIIREIYQSPACICKADSIEHVQPWSFVSESMRLNTEFIILNGKCIILNTEFINFNTNSW